MLNDDQILQLVLAAVGNLNGELSPDQQIVVTADTPLFGVDAVLDSLQLVSVIVDVEAALNSELGFALSLTDDQALSQAESPYRTPATLTHYIASRLRATAA